MEIGRISPVSEWLKGRAVAVQAAALVQELEAERARTAGLAAALRSAKAAAAVEYEELQVALHMRRPQVSTNLRSFRPMFAVMVLTLV